MSDEFVGWPSEEEINALKIKSLEQLRGEYFFVYTFQGKCLEDLADRIYLPTPSYHRFPGDVGPDEAEIHDAPFVQKYPELATERTQEGAQIAIPMMETLEGLFHQSDDPDDMMHLDRLILDAEHIVFTSLFADPSKLKANLPTAAEIGEVAVAFQDAFGRPWLGEMEREGMGEIVTSTVHGGYNGTGTWVGPEGPVVFSTVGDKLSYRIQDKDWVDRNVGVIPIVRPLNPQESLI